MQRLTGQHLFREHRSHPALYFSQMGESAIRTPTESSRTRFDRGDMLLAMERRWPNA